MYFGEYLVQQKILSPHQILKALDKQRSRRIFIPLQLVELGAMPDYQALHLCTQADLNHEDFLDVLLNEGLISQQQCTQIRITWMRSGPPLGSLLVEMGLMNEEIRAVVLEEFEAKRSLEENLSEIS